MALRLDSTMTPVRVYGYMTVTPDKNTFFQIDSIALTRVRSELAPNVHMTSRRFDIIRNSAEVNDTTKIMESDEAITNISWNNRPSRHQPSSRVTRPAASEIPKASSNNNERQSEHRKDALQHKPTPMQRQDANKRHTTPQKPLKRVPHQFSKMSDTTHYIDLYKHRRIVARRLQFGDEILCNVLISISDDRVEVAPFEHETHSTIYISQPLKLAPWLHPLPLHIAQLQYLGNE